jgi:hypothetical protein
MIVMPVDIDGGSFAEVTIHEDYYHIERVMLALNTNGSMHYVDIKLPLKKIIVNFPHYRVFDGYASEYRDFFNLFDAISCAARMEVDAIARVTGY